MKRGLQLEKDMRLEYGGQVRQRPEGGGNVVLFPKDMLNPVGIGRNDRTGQLVGPGTESVG